MSFKRIVNGQEVLSNNIDSNNIDSNNITSNSAQISGDASVGGDINADGALTVPEIYTNVLSDIFVATAGFLGQSSISAYSTNGITWTQATMPVSASWTSATYGDGTFAAIAYYSSAAAYSTNGVAWTQTTMPASASWRSVTYGDGTFAAVAGAYSTTAAYSTDAITWTQTTMPASVSWRSVTYSDGKFVALSGDYYDSSIAAYSTDAIAWTQTTLPSSRWQSVTYGDDKFVAIAYYGTAAYSTDAITWTQTNLPESDRFRWYSVTYGDGTFVALQGGTVVDFTAPIAAYSTDGITWTQTTLPTSLSWNSVTYGVDKFVAVEYFYGTISAYSTNGITWTQTTLPASAEWVSVTHGQGAIPRRINDVIVEDVDIPNNVITSQNLVGGGIPLVETTTKTANYTLALTDNYKVVPMNGSNLTLTVPANSSVEFPIGSIVNIYNLNSTDVTIAGAAGVTVKNAGALGEFAEASLRKRATNEWVLAGNVS